MGASGDPRAAEPSRERRPTKPDPELVELRRERYKKLREAGYPDEDAKLIARRTDVDLGICLKLLRKGCDPLLARRIVL